MKVTKRALNAVALAIMLTAMMLISSGCVITMGVAGGGDQPGGLF